MVPGSRKTVEMLPLVSLGVIHLHAKKNKCMIHGGIEEKMKPSGSPKRGDIITTAHSWVEAILMPQSLALEVLPLELPELDSSVRTSSKDRNSPAGLIGGRDNHQICKIIM